MMRAHRYDACSSLLILVLHRTLALALPRTGAMLWSYRSRCGAAALCSAPQCHLVALACVVTPPEHNTPRVCCASDPNMML